MAYPGVSGSYLPRNHRSRARTSNICINFTLLWYKGKAMTDASLTSASPGSGDPSLETLYSTGQLTQAAVAFGY